MAARVLVLLLAVLSWAAPARSAGLFVAPTTVQILSDASIGSLTLRNDSQETVRLRVQPLLWTNLAGGEMATEPTDDLVVSPALLQLAPGQSRRIRVGLQKPAVRDERSYRLLIAELPSSDAPQSGVTFRMQFSVPVFATPRERTASVDLSSPELENGVLRLNVRNAGRVHVTPTQVETIGRTSTGEIVWRHTFRPWYLLSRESRLYEVELHGEECARVATVEAEFVFAEHSGSPLRTQQAVGSSACRSR